MSASGDEEKCDSEREGDVADRMGNVNEVIVRNRHMKRKRVEKL
jgi:hypothetical protein